MTINEFKQRICQELAHTPTDDQQRAVDTFARFIADRHDNVTMIMSGAAGTGKTSLASAMVRTMRNLKQKMILLAPTGRAAKVLARNAGMSAYTIHRKIYREKSYSGLDGSFDINVNLHADTLFIIDESSMISNGGDGTFGTGCLLDDLVTYVYGGRNCRMMLIGDKSQLPPVGESESPALSPAALEAYGLIVYHTSLGEVVRQEAQSGILYNATAIRQLQAGCQSAILPKITVSRFADVIVVSGEDLVESIASSYSHAGIDDTIVITRSNKRANIYNMGIRNQVLFLEERLCREDQLMVVRNNYLVTAGLNDPTAPPFMANGDRCRILRIKGIRELYGFEFADARLQFPDYDGFELQATVLLDTLASDAPALTREQQNALFNEVMADYADIPRKADRMEKLRNDRHYNALQIKYAYAVTCHKAQGGQWAHVYLDQGYMTDETLTDDYFHWLYTAFTRATEKLFLVNWPQLQINGE